MDATTDIKTFVTGLMGSNPYDGFDATKHPRAITGWHSQHPWFEQIIVQVKPRRILEVGTWRGASAIHMAHLARQVNPQAQVLCIDTWLGSHRDLWTNAEYRKQLDLRTGFPMQYFQFLANVMHSGLQEHIFPLPMTSYCAVDILQHAGIDFDLIYIDAHHDEEEVFADMRRCYKLVRAGGMMFGDDYTPGETGVVKAVNRFVADHGLYLTTSAEKWAFQKP